MAIQFPINPQQGQQYTPGGIPITWQYDSGRHAWRVLRTGPEWVDIIGKPITFPPSAHGHVIADVTNLQESLNNKQDTSARGQANGYPSLDSMGLVPTSQLPPLTSPAWIDITGKPSSFPPSPHSHPVAEISDSSSVGQQIVRAPTPYDARQVIGAIGVDDNARVNVKFAGVSKGVRRAINFIEGLNVTMAIADDAVNEEVDVTINSSGGGGGSGAAFFVSDVKPVAPADNTLWMDSASGITYVYYNDGAQHQWIESTPYIANQPASFTKIIFPVAPVNDQVFTAFAGAVWKWSTARGVWYSTLGAALSYTKAESDAKFVDIIGDTMTGPLNLSQAPTAPLMAATKQYADDLAALKAPIASPTFTGDPKAPTPTAGDNDTSIATTAFVTAAAALKVTKAGDTMSGHLTLPTGPAAANAVRKDYVDAADSGKVAKAGDTMTGNLTISMADSALTLNKTVAGSHTNTIIGAMNGANRWMMQLGDGGTESGGNTGSNFALYACKDDGSINVGPPLTISRSTGQVTVAAALTVGTLTASGNVTSSDITTGPISCGAINSSGAVACGQFDNSGPITNAYGRILSKGGNSPSVTCYNTTIGYAMGFWTDPNGNIYFAQMDGAGNPQSAPYWQMASDRVVAFASYTAKPGGGPWNDSSDARIKNVSGDYMQGLDAIKTLRPVIYTFKGNDTAAGVAPSNKVVSNPDDSGTKDEAVVPYANSPHYGVTDKEFIGLIAQECEAAFPEMVSQTAGTIEGEPITDLRTIDTGPLLFALVNAVKTLAARIEALENG